MADENLQSNGTPEQEVELGAAVVPDVEPAKEVEAQPELPLEAKAEPEPEPEAKPEEVPEWARKEINKKHAKNKELERKLAESMAELESLRVVAQRLENPDAPPQAQPQAYDNQAAIDAAAQRIVAQREYEASVNAINVAGEKTYGAEWQKAIENLVTLGGDGSFTVEVMQGILATDDPAHVLLELGRKPAEYQRIMELPAAKRQTEMVKIAMQTPTKAKISSAPAPVDPVGGRPAPSAGLRDDMTDDEWNAARDAIERKRWEEKRARR